MKVLFEHEKATVSLNEKINAIELRWLKPQDPESYKVIFTKVLDLIKEYKPTGYLSDIRNEGVVGADSSKWVQTEIMPKAFGYGLQKIAVVMNADIFKTFYVKNVEKAAGSDRLKYFGDEASATSWLVEK